jgi:hypothetical protein
MNKLLTLAVSAPLMACLARTDAPSGGGTGGGQGNSAGDHITTDTTWTGTVDVARPMTVDPGVTLTIASGTTVRLAASTGIHVAGVVDVQGTKAAPVHLSPANAGGHHYGFVVPTNGELRMAYGVQVGGGISVEGGTITVTDTLMSRSLGDFLVADAGTVDVSYSAIGLEPGAGMDTSHCDLHFGGTSGSTFKVTHSNISTSLYGVMLYGGPGVDLTYNNWFSNDLDVDTLPGAGADVSYGWFEKGAPVAGGGATLIYDNRAAQRLVDAGPR